MIDELRQRNADVSRRRGRSTTRRRFTLTNPDDDPHREHHEGAPARRQPTTTCRPCRTTRTRTPHARPQGVRTAPLGGNHQPLTRRFETPPCNAATPTRNTALQMCTTAARQPHHATWLRNTTERRHARTRRQHETPASSTNNTASPELHQCSAQRDNSGPRSRTTVPRSRNTFRR